MWLERIGCTNNWHGIGGKDLELEGINFNKIKRRGRQHIPVEEEMIKIDNKRQAEKRLKTK